MSEKWLMWAGADRVQEDVSVGFVLSHSGGRTRRQFGK